MTYAVRVNEIKMTGLPGVGFELWLGQSWKYAEKNRLHVVYPTRFGRIVDVKCRDRAQAERLVEDFVERGIPRDVLRVVGDLDRVAK